MTQPTKLFLLLCCCSVLTVVISGVVIVKKSAHRSTQSGTAARPTGPLPEAAAALPAAPPIALSNAEAERSVPAGSSKALPTTVPPPSLPVISRARPPETKFQQKFLFFRANALGENYGKLSVVALDALDKPRYGPSLFCDRVHFSRTTGICLASDRGFFTKYYAVMFDKDLKPGWRIPLNGIPSRTRVSPSGRLAAITIFLSGHSYVSLNFSTQTIVVDSASGHVIADLETFAVTRNGLPFQSPDFNFWGVTFGQDDNQSYATLWSKGKTYLVKCNLRAHAATVIYDGVECPSLSPDNTRIAFKKRVDAARVTWRIHVLELKTMVARPTGETHSVDDQVEWLDNNHLLYSRSENENGSSASTDIWQVPASGEGTPTLLLEGAFSPAVASVI